MLKNYSVAVETAVTNQVPTRDQLNPSDTWDLSPIFPDDQKWEEALLEYKEKIPQLNETRCKLGKSAKALAEVLDLEKNLSMMAERLGQFAGLRLAEDAGNDANVARQAKLDVLTTRAAELSSHIRPEIQAIDDDTWADFLKDKALAEWIPTLEKIRRFRKHTLTPQEERLLALASEPLSGLDTAFSQLMNVDMKFGSVTDERGRELPLTQSTLSSFLMSQDSGVRERAFRRFYVEISEHAQVLAALLAHSVKTDVFYARARNYESARDAALFPDAVNVDVYNNLINEVRRGLPALQEYYELRREILKLKELHHYDTYVPLVSEIKKITPYDDAVEVIIQALRPLGEEYCNVLRDGLLEGRWVDRYETKGKRSGAFSWGCYGSPPYIMMNYKEDVFTDVYTLAHEAGHSMHTWYSHKNQRWQDAHYTIFAAEVTSTFNEELLTHYLIEQTADPKMKAYLISRQIDDIRGTLFRQTMFAEFEKITHEMQEAGEALTLGTMRCAYRKLLDTYLAPGVVVDSELELECLRIPHFYNAFYVYKYATGISAAISLSERVLKGSAAEKEQYLKFLSLGGLLHPLDALKTAGVDMSRPEPVRSAVELFAKRVTELKGLLA